jgi:hypothetical protein
MIYMTTQSLRQPVAGILYLACQTGFSYLLIKCCSAIAPLPRRGMTMTTRSNTASAWIDRNESSDWTNRIGEAARLLVDAMKAGYDAEYHYNKMTRHGTKPEQAGAAVLKRLAR